MIALVAAIGSFSVASNAGAEVRGHRLAHHPLRADSPRLPSPLSRPPNPRLLAQALDQLLVNEGVWQLRFDEATFALVRWRESISSSGEFRGMTPLSWPALEDGIRIPPGRWRKPSRAIVLGDCPGGQYLMDTRRRKNHGPVRLLVIFWNLTLMVCARAMRDLCKGRGRRTPVARTSRLRRR
jgi:hypothetical protein